MPSLIERYLMRETGLTLLAAALALLAMVFSHRLAGYLSKAASGLLARDSIFLLLSLQAVDMLTMLLPLAFLLSIMLTLGRLYRDHEMTALAACGQGPWAIYRALLLLAVPLALLTAGLSLGLTPAIMEYQFEVMAKARKEAEVSMFTPGVFREVMDGRHVIYIGALNARQLERVFVHTREPDGEISITTGARGHQEVGDDGIRHLILEEGYRYRGAPGRNDYDQLHFTRAVIRIDARPPEQDWKHQEGIPTSELLHSANPRYIAELHMRLNSPLQILILTLWAPALARSQPRSGRYARIVAAVLIYAIYFNLVGVGQSWLTHGRIPPAAGLWWVHAVFLLLGTSLLLRQQRGNGWRWPFRRRTAS